MLDSRNVQAKIQACLQSIYGTQHGDFQVFIQVWLVVLKSYDGINTINTPSCISYHEGLGKWVEIGNSGMFRPEMLLPMGLPEDVNVIAWGLSLERLVIFTCIS